jgi:hypothetical protein
MVSPFLKLGRPHYLCAWSVRVVDLSALSRIIITAASPVNRAAQQENCQFAALLTLVLIFGGGGQEREGEHEPGNSHCLMQ